MIDKRFFVIEKKLVYEGRRSLLSLRGNGYHVLMGWYSLVPIHDYRWYVQIYTGLEILPTCTRYFRAYLEAENWLKQEGYL